ncbi:MAG TPA: LLM class flavin-dependent oxidoreductase, partial [Candidatus Binatia bacterium]|nr:LLM class flavin-dependent oxidoreductase [Candidatus Binatia bacterium]
MRFGIQLYPPCIAPEMADFAARATSQYDFARVWVPDHLTYENVFVILAAIITRTKAHVGTSVVHPFSRTPVDLASSFASLAHLAGERGITVGIGAGSPSSNMIRKRNRVGMTREMILFLREMFAGRRVTLGEFPLLADFFRLDAKAEAFLRLPPSKPPEIYVAAAGPRMLELAWNAGDGLIVSNLSFPTALVRQGALDLAMAGLAAARKDRDDGRPFTKVLHLHVSVSRDGAAAKRCAKRMGAGALIQGHLLRQRMLELPVPQSTAGAVRAAHAENKTLDDLIDLISDDLLAEVGTVIAGTPAECIAGIDEMLRAAKPHAFDIVDIASPLGPDWHEAIDLICQEIIPEIEKRSSVYHAAAGSGS